MSFKELTEDRKAFFKERLSKNPELAPLREKLLEIGGLEIVPRFEEDLQKLLERGVSWGNKVKMTRGYKSQCHSNSAMLYTKNPIRYSIVVGWGLSDDGLWRQHTWIMDGDIIRESTEKRLAYFGTELNEEECAEFVFNNP